MATEQSRRVSLAISSDVRTRMVHLQVSDSKLIIGRAGAGQDPPGLDLSPYGGAERGVSRVHAALSYDGEAVYLEDLGSTSGTRLNGLGLEPHHQYRLRSQDELEFGDVRVTIRF